ncbi:MAG TPA: PQQ-binding-like beta-propeller repeat protein [Vicinamibacterales bacterium]|nr:PQQ-binding-like beta-propeller repeat protein [Vicinamibacterales bacterium]
MRIRLAVALLAAAAASSPWPARGQAADSARQLFETRCARCHGADGNGGEMGPPIAVRLSSLPDPDLAKVIRDGLPPRGMPPNPMTDAELAALLKFLRTIQREGPPVVRIRAETTDGRILEGQVLGEGLNDLQLRTDDRRVHLLRRAGDRFRRVTSDADWPSYNGGPGGNRYTTLQQIDSTTVSRLAPRWMFSIAGAGNLQVTPVVVGGIMYVTAPNECHALDAGTGRPIWQYKRPRTKGVAGGNANRGVGVAGDRVYMVTDHAHLIALNRFTGELIWDTEMDDWRKNYAASSAPLPVGNLVISGVSGGEHGANGFVAAYDAETGREVWRFWTVPRRGEPGSETWQGKDIDHGGAPTWFTGTYDPALDTVYWPTGNPSKEYDGTDRKGDNLYSDSILALDRATGKLRWYYQFTPHDLWDWDAGQTPVLVDADWQGQSRRLLLHANRNGFFYVFDRTDGTMLLARPFVRNLTWASGIGSDGRPVKLPDQEPTPQGTKVCPSQDGATNWFSPSFNPATGLYYVQTFEKCSIYTKSEQGEWESGKTYLGGSQRTAPDPKPQRILKAIDVRSGAIVWELPQPGPAISWGGTLTTATGLVIVGEEGGALLAVDAVTGTVLWSFPTNQVWKASPMTYAFDGTQYIAVAAGAAVIAFGLQ